MRTTAPTRNGPPTMTISVDLGATSVRVVEIEAGAGDSLLRVVRRGVAPLPHGLWNDLPAHRDALSAAITQALGSAGITGKAVVACMPRRMVTLRFVRLPHAPPEAMEGMVAMAAQEYVLFPLDDVVLDHHVIVNPLDAAGLAGDDLETVLLAAARRSLIDDVLYAFDHAGLELLQLSASALALAEIGRDSLDPTALIDVEPGEMDVAVVADGQLLFTRASALDVQGVRPEVAERREVEEVVRSFTAYQNEFRHRPIAHVFVGGESATGSAGESLNRALVEMLEMPVSGLNPRGMVPGDSEARAYATAIGMAMQARPGSIAPINLVPNERAERKAALVRQSRQRLLAVAGVVVFGIAVWIGNAAFKANAKNQQLALVESADLKRNNEELVKVKKDHDRVAATFDHVSKGLDRDHPAVDVLYAINHALPTVADIWLTQFQFDRGGVLTIHGETKNATAATQLVLALQRSGAFTDVRLGYLGDSQENTPVPQAIAPASVATPTPAPVATPTPAPAPTTLPGSGFGGGGLRGGGAFNPGGGGFNGGGGGFNPAGGGFNGGGGGFNGGGGGFNGGGGGFNPGGNPGASNFDNSRNSPITDAPAAPAIVEFTTLSVPTSDNVIIQSIKQSIDANGLKQIDINTSDVNKSPSGRASQEDGGIHLASDDGQGGHLVLVGQAPQDSSSRGGGGGGSGRRGGGGFGGFGGFGGQGGFGRQRGGRGGGTGSADATSSSDGGFQGGRSVPQTGGGNAQGGGNPGASGAATPPAQVTYGSGSIYGAAATPTTGATNPDGSPMSGRGRGRFGNFGGGFPSVPSLSPPNASGIQPSTSARKPIVKATAKPTTMRQTLTSFIITCRVNLRRKDLVPADATMPVAPAQPAPKSAKKVAPKTTTDSQMDNGGDDADTQ